MRLSSLPALFGALFLQPVYAQVYRPALFSDTDRLAKVRSAIPAIDKIYKDFAQKNNWPGMVYGIVVDGRLVHTGGAGFIDLAAKLPAGAGSDFRIASMSKSFTAMAILKLRDEGKLHLDDPASVYIPELKAAAYPSRDASPLTIRQLMTHAAGFPEDNPWGDRQLDDTDAELLALFKKGISFSNDPGLTYEYSNLGFATLGLIIRKVTGMPYQDYIREHVFKPLGMTNSYWEYSKVPPKQLAHGYRRVGSDWVEQPLLHDGAYGAMGGLITTMDDFAKYVSFHLSAWPARNDAETGPVKRSSVREMHFPWNFAGLNTNARLSSGKGCPTTAAYGYGLRWTRDCEGRTYVGHSGGLPGFGSNWSILPEYGIGVICFANLTYAAAGTPNKQAIDTLLALTGLNPRQLPPSTILNQRKKELIALLPSWEKAKTSGIFAENFFSDYFIDQLKADASAAFEKAGKIVSTGELIAENQLRGYFVLQGEKAKLRISFTLSPENPALIQEYRLSVLN